MNWNGGTLPRASKSTKTSVSTIQKRHFAKARGKLQAVPRPLSDFDFSLFQDARDRQIPRRATGSRRGRQDRQQLTQRTLDEYDSISPIVRRLESIRPHPERRTNSAKIRNRPQSHMNGKSSPCIKELSSRPSSVSIFELKDTTNPQSERGGWHPSINDMLEGKRRELLCTRDWVGLENIKPVKIVFADAEDRDMIGKRRRVEEKDQGSQYEKRHKRLKPTEDIIKKISRPRMDQQRFSSSDDISIRIGNSDYRLDEKAQEHSQVPTQDHNSILSEEILFSEFSSSYDQPILGVRSTQRESMPLPTHREDNGNAARASPCASEKIWDSPIHEVPGFRLGFSHATSNMNDSSCINPSEPTPHLDLSAVVRGTFRESPAKGTRPDISSLAKATLSDLVALQSLSTNKGAGETSRIEDGFQGEERPKSNRMMCNNAIEVTETGTPESEQRAAKIEAHLENIRTSRPEPTVGNAKGEKSNAAAYETMLQATKAGRNPRGIQNLAPQPKISDVIRRGSTSSTPGIDQEVTGTKMELEDVTTPRPQPAVNNVTVEVSSTLDPVPRKETHMIPEDDVKQKIKESPDEEAIWRNFVFGNDDENEEKVDVFPVELAGTGYDGSSMVAEASEISQKGTILDSDSSLDPLALSPGRVPRRTIIFKKPSRYGSNRHDLLDPIRIGKSFTREMRSADEYSKKRASKHTRQSAMAWEPEQDDIEDD